MTYAQEKAASKTLSWIKSRLESIEKKIKGKTATKAEREEKSALMVAKSAMMRQTPVLAIQPVKDPEAYACPRCGHHFEEKPFYCNHCGQHVMYNKDDLSSFDIVSELVARKYNVKYDNETGIVLLEVTFNNCADTITVDITDIVDYADDITESEESGEMEIDGDCKVYHKLFH